MSASPITGPNVTLTIPFHIFLLLPLWIYFLIVKEHVHPVLMLAWLLLCLRYTSTALWQIGRICPPIRRYHNWAVG
jgi:hypothetical protein